MATRHFSGRDAVSGQTTGDFGVADLGLAMLGGSLSTSVSACTGVIGSV